MSPGSGLSRPRCREVAARPRRPRALGSTGGPRVPSADGGDGRKAAGAAAAPQPPLARGCEGEMLAGLGAGGGLSPPAWVQARNGAVPAEARPHLLARVLFLLVLRGSKFSVTWPSSVCGTCATALEDAG